MKKILLALAALSMAASLPVSPDRNFPVREKEEIRNTFKTSGTAELIVDNVIGRIKVEGYEGTEISLVAVRTIEAESGEKVRQAKAEVRLDVIQNGDTLKIYVDGPFRRNDPGLLFRRHQDPGYIVRYDFELRVPRRTGLDVRTVNDGDIEVENVEGNFDVANVNGRVRMTGVRGSGDVRTVNGEIAVSFRSQPAGECSFRTVNGEVVLGFPENPSADFRIKTMNGEIFTDFPVTGLPAADGKAKRNEAGRFVYKSDRFFVVRAGKGGPEIKLETLNGDILIKKTA
jgi:hypothetical protein